MNWRTDTPPTGRSCVLRLDCPSGAGLDEAFAVAWHDGERWHDVNDGADPGPWVQAWALLEPEAGPAPRTATLFSPSVRPNVRPMSWEEFRGAGLLWLANRMLLVFGVAVAVEVDEDTGEIVRAYPARVPWRGFSPDDDVDGAARLVVWVTKNTRDDVDAIDSLLKKG